MDGMICRPMSRWFQRSWRSRTQPLSDGFHSRSLACQCPHSPRSPGMDPTWYAVGMAPKVAELRSLASDDKRRRSPQIDSQHCANLASPYPIANRSLLCAPFPNDAALLQPHFVHFVGFVFIPTHSRAICSWNSSAVFGGHGQTHSLGAVDRFDSSWIAGLPLPTPLRVRDATSSWWVRAANRVVANLQEELRTAAAGLDS